MNILEKLLYSAGVLTGSIFLIGMMFPNRAVNAWFEGILDQVFALLIVVLFYGCFGGMAILGIVFVLALWIGEPTP